jgi:hypothetical protein
MSWAPLNLVDKTDRVARNESFVKLRTAIF